MSKCNCRGMVRTWEETLGGKYPISDHHPACDEYELEHFATVTDECGTAVIEIQQLSEWCQASLDSGEPPNIGFIEITRDQFEKMPEYIG